MKVSVAILAVAIAILASASALPVQVSLASTVNELKVDQYLGRWFQVASSFVVVNAFEKDAVCATADYSSRDDGKIGVVNTQRLKTVDGTIANITGYVYNTDANQPGQFKLHLGTVPVDGSYWILALGPVVNGKYQYSIVSEPYSIQLYILVRDVADYESNYAQEVASVVEKLGFTHFWNKPIPTLQKGCTYPW